MQKNYQVGKFYLDEYQMQLLNNDTNTIVIAGAGAGKTLTIIGKINYLIDNKINPTHILVISFTNASVNDIKKKLSYDNIDFYTFHKLAMSILEKAQFNYKIANDTLLNYIINEYLSTLSPTNQKNILKYLKINTSYSKFLISKEYQSFVKLIETFINLWKTNNLKFSDIPLNNYTKLEKNILLLIFQIYEIYTQEKMSNNTLDFDDLILMAAKYVKNTKLNYEYIIIDEFQDTSFLRLNLIKEIYKYTNAKIIVVGDDWQSIYRFSGCDLNIFINFTNIFTNTKTIKLVNTYRNSQELINIAATFVMKNPKQISKSLKSNTHTDQPLIFVPYQNKVKTFKKLLDYLITTNEELLILGRNNKDIYNYLDSDFKIKDNLLIYKGNEIKYLSVHKSKGLEAYYVIILNCNNDYLGFPNKIENSDLINKMYQDNEIPYAEERRLFYVAITRCKKSTYLMYSKDNPSPFIKEIKKITKKQLKRLKYFR